MYHSDKNSESHAELLLILLLLPNFSIILDKSHSQYMKMLLLLAKSAYDAYKKSKNVHISDSLPQSSDNLKKF